MMSKQELAMLIEKLKDCSAALERLAEHLQGAAQEGAAENDSATVDIALEVEVNAPLKSGDTAENIDDVMANAVKNTVENVIDNVVDNVIEVTAEEVEDVPEKAAQSPNEAPQTAQSTRPGGNVQASANNPFARLFAGLNVNNGGVPNGANPFNLLNMLAGGKGGLPGLGGLPGITNNLPTTLTELHDNPQLMNMLNQVANNPQSLNMMSGLTGQSPEALQAALNSLQPGATPAAAPMATATVPTAPAPTLPPIAAAPAVTPTAHLDSLLAEWHWGPYARVWTR